MSSTAQPPFRVTYVVGSLAAGSINRRLSRALVELAPPDLDLREAPIATLPLYNYELDKAFPEPARAFKQAIVDADAVLIITPEYNRSIPGSLKNAIDWASRPYGDNAFAGKATAIIGTSSGKVGTAVAQQHLRGVLNYCDAVLMNQPEAYVQFNKDVFDGQGTISDPSLVKVLQAFMTAFRDHIVRTANFRREPVPVGAGRA
jgi:chromate reductase